MRNNIKPVSVGFKRLKNTTYSAFMHQMSENVKALDTRKLGNAELFEQFHAKASEMTKLVGKPAAHAETQEMLQCGKARVRAYLLLRNLVVAHKYSDEPAKLKAYLALSAVLKPYLKLQKKPQDIITESILSLVMNLRKEPNAVHINALGLAEQVDALEKANRSFIDKQAERQSVRQSDKENSAHKLRPLLNSLYKDVIDIISAICMHMPSDELEDFIAKHNAYTKDLRVRVKIREGVHAYHRKRKFKPKVLEELDS